MQLFGVAQTTTETFTTAGTNTFVVPAGVTSITVEAWGAWRAGGNGTGGSKGTVGGGGGGGAYAQRSGVTVSGGTSYTITVGTGGTGSFNGSASTATFGAKTITANGGSVGSIISLTPSGGNGEL